MVSSWSQKGICIVLGYYMKLGKKEWKLVDKLDVPLLQMQNVQTLAGLAAAVLLYLQSFHVLVASSTEIPDYRNFRFDLK